MNESLFAVRIEQIVFGTIARQVLGIKTYAASSFFDRFA
jgi:hypothetical protein